MSVTEHARRIADFGAALALSRRMAADERLPEEARRRQRRERLDAVVRHAIAHSPLHRERLGPLVGAGPVDLGRLPVLTKADMMEHFDDLVTDRRLRRDELLVRAERGEPGLLHGRYRVMATSGSSGRTGLFVYDRPSWRLILAQFLRQGEWMELRPRLPRRRIAAVMGASPTHMSRQVTASVSVGAHRVLGVPVTAPIAEIVAALNRFGPEFLNAYPSMALLLAEEQLAGRLRLRLHRLSTSSELCTPEAAARLEEAFGVRPFDVYASTEGLWGIDCEHHAGIHLFDDVTLVENVDDDGHPVAAGEPGARLLLTGLHPAVQPLIRFELTDSVTLASEPCACGRTLARLASIEGRSDDVLRLAGRGGAPVAVHPLQFSVVARDRDVREFQVVQEGPLLRLLIVPRATAPGLDERLRIAVAERLAELGVAAPQVAVERRSQLDRSAGGKLQMVVADGR
ncbi:MAG TPA: hypothetical protein VLA98_07200 [Solirubrobacteraceae bacterium]|nr:hypothetical protein [Solirubrobacteraceae bacterium]